MKFTTKQVFSALFILLLATEFCIAFERKSRSHRSHHKLSRSYSKSREPEKDPEYFLNVTNKWYAFIAGVFVGIGGGETKWMGCLPANWVKEAPAEQEKPEQKKEADGYKTWSPILKSIVTVVGAIAKGICWVQKQVIVLIKLVIAGVKAFSKKRFFRFKSLSSIQITRKKAFSMRAIAYHKGHYNLSKRNMLKIQGWFDDLIDTIADAFDSIGSTLFQSAEDAYNFVASGARMAKDAIKAATKRVVASAVANFPGPVAAFQAIADYIKSLVDRVKLFFQSDTWKTIKAVFDCLNAAVAFASEFKEAIMGVISKVKEIIVSVATLSPLALAALADIILALLCNWDKFAKAVEWFTKASAETVPVKSYEFWGRGIGGIVNAIGTAPTIKETFETALEGRKFKRKI